MHLSAAVHLPSRRPQGGERCVTTLKLESIGRVAAGMAHELNTPLQYVNDNLTFLRRALQLLTPALDALRQGERVAAPSIDWGKLAHVVDQMAPAIEQALEGVERMARLTAELESQHEASAESRRMVAISQIIESSLVDDRSPPCRRRSRHDALRRRVAPLAARGCRP